MKIIYISNMSSERKTSKKTTSKRVICDHDEETLRHIDEAPIVIYDKIPLVKTVDITHEVPNVVHFHNCSMETITFHGEVKGLCMMNCKKLKKITLNGCKLFGDMLPALESIEGPYEGKIQNAPILEQSQDQHQQTHP